MSRPSSDEAGRTSSADAERINARRGFVIRERDADLFEVIHALRAPRRLARLLNRGKEQTDQDPDHRDHDQNLDQRESATRFHGEFSDCNIHDGFVFDLNPRAIAHPAKTETKTKPTHFQTEEDPESDKS